MSSWGTIQDHIMERFNAQTTIPAARIDWTSFNAPSFKTPDYKPGITAAADAVWVRPSVVGLQGVSPPIRGINGPGPMGIGPSAPSYRTFIVMGMFFTPAGVGQSVVRAWIDEFNGIFHRQSFGTSPVVTCRDADEPMVLGRATDTDEWFQINASVPGWVQDLN